MVVIYSNMTHYIELFQKNLERKEGSLTGSQRQRGMYMNAGSSDAGVDPDWDPVERKWKGTERRQREQQERLDRVKKEKDAGSP